MTQPIDKNHGARYNSRNDEAGLLKQIARHARGLALAAERLAEHRRAHQRGSVYP